MYKYYETYQHIAVFNGMIDNVEYNQPYNFNYQGDFLNPLYCSAAHENKGKQTLTHK